MSSYTNVPNWVQPLRQFQSAGCGCLECGAEHHEATCGKEEGQGQLAMPTVSAGLGRGAGHICTAGPGPGCQASGGKLCLTWSGAECRKRKSLQEPGRYLERMEEARRACVYLAEYFRQQVTGKEGLLWRLSGKESTCRCQRRGFNPWVRKIPWRRKRVSTRGFLPEKSHGETSPAGYSPCVCKRVGHKLAAKQKQRKKPNLTC